LGIQFHRPLSLLAANQLLKQSPLLAPTMNLRVTTQIGLLQTRALAWMIRQLEHSLLNVRGKVGKVQYLGDAGTCEAGGAGDLRINNCGRSSLLGTTASK
jgi:hypothetical protein